MGFAGKMQKQSQQPFNGVRSSRWEHHISCERAKREDSLTLFHFQLFAFVHFNEFPVKYKYSLDLIAVSKSSVLAYVSFHASC